jgi:preprotein translocase subunit SecF
LLKKNKGSVEMKKILSIISLIFIISVTFIGCKANEKSIDKSKTNVAEAESSTSSKGDNEVQPNSKNSALKLLISKGEKN